ncbi:hypothetical protein [Thiofilum flexile]|uniref:hypothetical protein n=1 Tax=Thiofilum flexile TaxID=125627 RepID=UPI000361D168|nr:hypothetical protein [Thiofilum flexile]
MGNGQWKTSWSRISVIVCALFLFIFGLAFLSSKNHRVIQAKKATLITIKNALFPAKDLVENCLLDRETVISQCPSVNDYIAKLPVDNNRIFFVSNGGELIGIDFEYDVVAVLRPIISDKITWECLVDVGDDSRPLSASCKILTDGASIRKKQ